jgi:hypothetical protein
MSVAQSCSVLSSLALLLACGCGGAAPAAEPPPELPHPVLQRILATAELDGVVWNDGSFDTSGETLPLLVGDHDGVSNGLAARQFYSFDMSGIPAGSTIFSAAAMCTQVDRVGTPYDTHGPVVVELVDYGLSLDGSDYDTPALAEASGHVLLGPDGDLGADVTGAVVANLAASMTRVQVRVRFRDLDSDSDGQSDHVVCADAELSPSGSIHPPTLTIHYRPPP